MRLVEIVTLCEESDDVPTYIRRLRDDWIYNKGMTLWDVGNGRCEEFAMAVIKHFPERLYDLTNDNFMIGKNGERDENDVWDIRALQSFHSLPPISVDKLNKINFGTHVWVYDKKSQRHFDAEKPEGVASFWKLPFFIRQLKGKQ